MPRTEALRDALARMRPRHLEDLRRLISVPSVSAQGTGIDEAVEVVVDLLRERGLTAEVHPTPGFPIVTAHGGAADAPTLLFYEHYDVQPPEPIDAWTSPPFELTERDGKLFGRGVADTKGHLVCRLAAIDAAREIHGDDRIGYRFVVEGEEEIGSPNLDAFIEANADRLRADGCIWEFGGVDHDGSPVISLGLKGIVSLELHATGPSYDAHSSLGAVIDNPLYRISAAIASLRDQTGRVTVDGFYDDVVPLTDLERAVLERSPDQAALISSMYGVDGLLGSTSGPDLVRRLEAAPCLNVNGIWGGYTGR
ncbi:MAG TPA: M20/M25/M40 family metallo-hydrolase, partial [Actinomycetota bacterium]|nr:M20/M25/M40 family metallo-hydrolase [Actinomycetota bacterium]